MGPTLWLKNAIGDIWDLRPKSLRTTQNGSFLQALDGTGFDTKLTYARIKHDLVITEEVPQQVDITGTMFFRNPEHMERFGQFIGDYSNTVSFFYDPTGRIDPRSQIDRPWYKEVRVTRLNSGEQDKNGYWLCKMVFSPLSSMWRRDTTIASTASLVVGDPHTYAFVYPYFYQSESKLFLEILNEGERIGCRISIKNTQTTPLTKLEWVVNSGTRRQYARWLAGIGIQPNRTLVVDSTPINQEASVYYEENLDDVQDYQEPNPQYINFVDLHPGNNQIVFNLGTVEGVEVEASFTEQVRAI